MNLFDEKSEEYKSLPKEFRTFVRFLNRGKKDPAESEKSKELVDRQFKLIEHFVSLPTDTAIIAGVEEKDGKKFAWILQNGRRRKVHLPEKHNIFSGVAVEISAQTAQIISKAELPFFGPVAKVARILDEESCEVVIGSETKAVLRGLFGPKGANCSLETGDRVVLDQVGVIILANLGKEENKFKLENRSSIVWDDIVGLEDAKEKLIEMIELPYTHAELFKYHNKKQIKGALLHGPHGNGKTMLLEASASASAKIHGPEALQSGYIYIKASELLEGIVGEGEKKIHRLFRQGEEHFEKYGYPAIIAIEEPDAVFIKRGTGKSSDVERSMVDAMLAEMNHTRSIILMATNRPDILDPALLRDKRIDYKIYVGRPTKTAVARIVEISLNGAPLEGSAKELGEYVASEFFSEKRSLYEIRRKSSGETIRLTLGNIVYGAMAASTAEKAKSIAFQRDVKENTKTATGKKELLQAIDGVFEENIHLDHLDEIRDFIRDFKDDVSDIKTLRQMK